MCFIYLPFNSYLQPLCNINHICRKSPVQKSPEIAMIMELQNESGVQSYFRGRFELVVDDSKFRIRPVTFQVEDETSKSASQPDSLTQVTSLIHNNYKLKRI